MKTEVEAKTSMYGPTVRCAIAVFVGIGILAGGGYLRAAPSTSSFETRLSSASASACSTALGIYEELTNDESAPDSIRALSAGLRGDAAFAMGDYDAAEAYYEKAMRFSRSDSRYQYCRALAARAGGDTAQAKKDFLEVAQARHEEGSRLAYLALGDLAQTSGDYEKAMALYQKTGSFSAKNSWSVSAFCGKLACAKRLGLADSAAVYERLLSLYAKTMLEKEQFKMAREQTLQKKDVESQRKKQHKTIKAASKYDTTFTLQVGAFGSKERASALAKKLSKKYKNVDCVAALVSNRTLYRVWVGDFSTREEAETFGRERLGRRGHEYRIIIKN
ncbi:MAG: SPOR domain-containing protein [Chitinispirillaceae bacterium]|nr:SPOR domain-containing protein [Chitinispirillaceae bacterium]